MLTLKWAEKVGCICRNIPDQELLPPPTKETYTLTFICMLVLFSIFLIIQINFTSIITLIYSNIVYLLSNQPGQPRRLPFDILIIQNISDHFDLFDKLYNLDLHKHDVLAEHVGNDALIDNLGNLDNYHLVFLLLRIFFIILMNLTSFITLIYANMMYLLSMLGMMLSPPTWAT